MVSCTMLSVSSSPSRPYGSVGTPPTAILSATATSTSSTRKKVTFLNFVLLLLLLCELLSLFLGSVDFTLSFREKGKDLGLELNLFGLIE